MDYLKIGNSDIAASRIGFGGMVLSGTYGTASREESLETLGAAFDSGVNFFDTADVYGAGENERLIGEFIKVRRSRVVVATKGGATRDSQGRATNNGDPKYLIQACNYSLTRLGVSEIDLYYLHRVDPRFDIEESVGALASLVKSGKVRAIGLSEVSVETLKRAAAVHPISALQTEYSLACRFAEDELFSACAALGISFVAYSPLGRGLLGGAISSGTKFENSDVRRNIPRFLGGELEHNLQFVTRLSEIAKELGFSVAQLALAWVLSSNKSLFAIPGTRNLDRARTNAQACDIMLPHWVLEELNSISSDSVIKGARHNDAMLARTGL